MDQSEIDVIRNALQLLRTLLPDDQGRAGDPTPRRCPVLLFAQRYLTAEPGSDLTTAELWRFYGEVAASGELEPLTKQAFQRALRGAMEAVFGVKKCHSVVRTGRRAGGFRGVGIRLDASPPAPVLEIEGEVE